MKEKTFERELPEGYTEVFSVDAKADKKFIVWMNIVSVFVIVAVTAVAVIVIKPQGFFENYSFLRNTILLAALFLYIVLHEAVHGIAYKAMTGEKLTFGLTFSVAYCGVPDIFVYRRTALVALLSPFVIFTALFGIAVFVFSDPWDRLYAALILGFHLGGCAGDLYDTLLFMIKLRNPGILMKDTGPKQTFYKKVGEVPPKSKVEN